MLTLLDEKSETSDIDFQIFSRVPCKKWEKLHMIEYLSKTPKQ